MQRDIADKYPHKELTYKLLGIFFKVHNLLGNTLQERFYDRAIEKELIDSSIPYKKECEVDLKYEGVPIGKHRLDFIVDNKVVVETKTMPFIDGKCLNQLLSYLKSTGVKVGIMANFRTPRLTYRRLVNPLIG